MTSPQAQPPVRRHLAGSVFSVGLSRITALIAVALTSIVIARLLGPSGIGTYALCATLLFMASVVFEAGLSQSTAYFVGRGEWTGRALATGLLGACAALGVVGTGAMLLGYALLGSDLPGVTWPMAIALSVALPWGLVWRCGPQAALALERFELYAVLESAWVVIALPVSIILAAAVGLEASVIGFAASLVVAGTVVAAWLVANARRTAAPPAAPPGGARAVARYGVRAWIPELLQQLNYRADLVLLGALTTAADTGVYSIAISITSIAWLLSGSLATSVLPRSASLSAASEQSAGGEAEHDASDARALRHAVLLIPALGLMEIVLLLAGVPLIYGSAFDRSVELGLILLPGTLFLGVGAVALSVLLGRGRSDRVMWVGLAVVPVTIAAYALVIPELGATGAALVSSVSYLCLTILAVTVLDRETRLGARTMLVPTGDDVTDYRIALSSLRAGLKRRFAGP